jgi:hypothetical protein
MVSAWRAGTKDGLPADSKDVFYIVVHAKIKALWLGLLVAASSGGGTTGSFTKISSVVDGSH